MQTGHRAPPDLQPRIDASIASVEPAHWRAPYRALLASRVVLSVLCLPVLAHHKSPGEGLLFGWSAAYFAGALLPCAGLLLAQSALLGSNRLRRQVERLVRERASRRGRAAVLAILTAFGIAWAVAVRTPQARLAAVTLAGQSLLLVGSIALRRPQLLATDIALGAAAAVLFAFELPVVAETRTAATTIWWGEDKLFAHLFPDQPPFIGAGGRLRAGVTYRMQAPGGDSLGVRITTNAQGFRNDRGTPLHAPPGERRVLSLGDSFACGYGVEQDAFFGPRLERRLRAVPGASRITVLNAEVSDPAYGLYFLQEHGLRYRPEVVLYGLFLGNDLLQSYCGAGHRLSTFVLENGDLRANPNAEPGFSRRVTTELSVGYPYRHAGRPPAQASAPPSPAPRREPGGIAALSRRAGDLIRLRAFVYLRRLLRDPPVDAARPGELMGSHAAGAEARDGRKQLLEPVHSLGLFTRDEPAPVADMYPALFRLLRAMRDRTRAAGAELVLVVFPQRFQVQSQDWQALRDRWNLDEADFDLDRPNARLARFCAHEGIAFCDLTPGLRAAARGRNLYFPGDMHLNAAGHDVAAREAARTVAATRPRVE